MSNSNTSIRRRAFIPKEDCPMAMAADILGDRWTLLILREAFYGVQRYDDMREDLGAPRSMLTDRLAGLVEKGLMTREPYQEPGSRVRQAYVLTPAGKALALTFLALTQWGEEFILKDEAPVRIIESATQKPVRVVLITDDKEVISPSAARLVKRSKPDQQAQVGA